MSRCIQVEGVLMQVTAEFDENDPEQMEALAGLARFLKARMAALPEPTPEEIERQEQARRRNRERIERLGLTP